MVENLTSMNNDNENITSDEQKLTRFQST